MQTTMVHVIQLDIRSTGDILQYYECGMIYIMLQRLRELSSVLTGSASVVGPSVAGPEHLERRVLETGVPDRRRLEGRHRRLDSRPNLELTTTAQTR